MSRSVELRVGRGLAAGPVVRVSVRTSCGDQLCASRSRGPRSASASPTGPCCPGRPRRSGIEESSAGSRCPRRPRCGGSRHPTLDAEHHATCCRRRCVSEASTRTPLTVAAEAVRRWERLSSRSPLPKPLPGRQPQCEAIRGERVEAGEGLRHGGGDRGVDLPPGAAVTPVQRERACGRGGHAAPRRGVERRPPCGDPLVAGSRFREDRLDRFAPLLATDLHRRLGALALVVMAGLGPCRRAEEQAEHAKGRKPPPPPGGAGPRSLQEAKRGLALWFHCRGARPPRQPPGPATDALSGRGVAVNGFSSGARLRAGRIPRVTRSQRLLAAFFTFAGAMHFVAPRRYVAMMPPSFPAHRRVGGDQRPRGDRRWPPR